MLYRVGDTRLAATDRCIPKAFGRVAPEAMYLLLARLTSMGFFRIPY
jgi:hypothetical protein